MKTNQTTNCRDHGQPGNKAGYAQRHRDGVKHYVHRLALADATGVPIAAFKGLVVRHTNPRQPHECWGFGAIRETTVKRMPVLSGKRFSHTH